MSQDNRPQPFPDKKTEDMIQFLAHEQVARDITAALLLADEQPARDVSGAELVAYAMRDKGAPVDFRLERQLRTDTRSALKYRRILQSKAIGYSQMAMAAGSGSVPERRIGGYGLKVVEDGTDTYLILSQEAGQQAAPTVLEAIGKDDSVRVPLSSPVRGHIQIIFDDQNSDLVRLLKLLSQPNTELYLM
jgi:hypothetical protein